jgi:hypothetical protein
LTRDRERPPPSATSFSAGTAAARKTSTLFPRERLPHEKPARFFRGNGCRTKNQHAFSAGTAAARKTSTLFPWERYRTKNQPPFSAGRRSREFPDLFFPREGVPAEKRAGGRVGASFPRKKEPAEGPV